jgi:hypothetical protein
MSSRERLHRQTLSAALVILGVAVFAMGQANSKPSPQPVDHQSPNTQTAATQANPAASFKSNARQQPSPSPPSPSPRREENKRPPDPTRYSYEFTQPQFYIRHVLVEHDASGSGKITFEHQGDAAPLVDPVELSTAALGRIMGLWSDLRFLESNENYQAEKHFPHLGTMRIHMENGERKRTAEFNWTNNKQASALITEYRRVADQAIFLFDLSVARENQPLNSPKLMEQLENMLTRGDVSDPYQLVPLLRDLTTDERLPLIARNHAGRLLKRIEK